MVMGSFICQVSERDWNVSRKIGVYGNREGTDRKGKTTLFRDMSKGDEIVQSIIEDLIGMQKGDIVFFHIVKTSDMESRVHGVYCVSEEPFYNDKVKLWDSNPELLYPYRFCVKPHPDHLNLCEYGANIPVSEFYRAIENRDIRSITTLEREERGAAHAIKTITTKDSEEIIKLLYKAFHYRQSEESLSFKPIAMEMDPLRNYIKRIGEIEFSIKALVAYELGRKDPNIIQFIPACASKDYDFLIESFIGQTIRRPADIICLNRNETAKSITVIEAKTDKAKVSHLIQSIKYCQQLRLANLYKDGSNLNMSIVLLAKRFDQELVEYACTRNIFMPWESVILLKYKPTSDGKDASFSKQILNKPSALSSPLIFPSVDASQLRSLISSKPTKIYAVLKKKTLPNIILKTKKRTESDIILEKYLKINGKETLLGHVLLHASHGEFNHNKLIDFIARINDEAKVFKGDSMAVDPVIIAKSYDALATYFIVKYNAYEIYCRRQPISAYLSANV